MTTTTPYSPESEQAVLSIILGNPDHASELISRLHADLFYNPVNRMIFDGFKAILSSDIPLELMSATDFFSSRGLLDKVGGASALTELYSIFSSTAHFNHYEGILSDRFKQREIQAICLETHTIASGSLEGQNVDNVLAEFTERVLTLSLDRKQHLQKTFSELCDSAIDRFDANIRNGGRITGTSTGFSILDNITGGHLPGQLWVIGGGTSDGKSAIAQQMALHKATKGISCAIYTFEMPDEEIIDRFYSMMSCVDSQSFKRGFKSREDQKMCIHAHQQLRGLPITIRDVSGLKLSPLIADIRMLATRGVTHFCVDYAQLVEGDAARSREEEIAKISRTLKAAAKQLHVSIDLLAQLNDNGKLRESRALGFDADVVLTISTPTTRKSDGKHVTEERDESKRTLFVGKNRNGKRNHSIFMNFDGSTFTFREIHP